MTTINWFCLINELEIGDDGFEYNTEHRLATKGISLIRYFMKQLLDPDNKDRYFIIYVGLDGKLCSGTLGPEK